MSCRFRLLFVLTCAPTAFAVSPPGYEFIRVTDTSYFENRPRLNSHGDVVFTARFDNKESQEEIMLYRNGEFTQITDNDVSDREPVIADDGTICWATASGPDGPYGPTLEIARWKDGVVDFLTDDDADDRAPAINSVGHIVWQKYVYDGCHGSNKKILLNNGSETRELTDGSFDDQSRDVNEYREVVWTRYDNCADPWDAEIVFLDRDGQLHFLSDDQFEPQSPTINNAATIAWDYIRDDKHALVLFKNGELIDFGIGSTPRLNNHDDIVFIKGGGSSGKDQIWAYVRGEFCHLSDDAEWNSVPDINDRTDLVWIYRAPLKSDIVMLKRLPFGDMNCDKLVNFNDIDGFVLALTAGKDEFQKTYPDCDWWLADMNDDRSIDFNDIDPFVECLINGGCER